MNFYTITFNVFLTSIPLAGVINRIRQLKRADGLVNTTGVVTQFEHKLTGDSTYVYVDVIYNFGGAQYYGFDLSTNSVTARGFEVGSHIIILVDPLNPRECRVKTVEGGDRFLRYLFGQFITSN